MPSRFSFLSLALFSLAYLLSPLGHAAPPASPTSPTPANANAPAAPNAPPTDPASVLVAEAIVLMNHNDVDGALGKLNDSIKLNPRNAGTYVLRASIYYQKKMWAQAEQDFRMASDLNPKDAVIKINLIEMKFIQKQFDLARPGYLALEGDPDMGDFYTYKVFLCDLFSGHEALAQKELDAFNKVGGNASYYFGNAASDLVHKHIDSAREWLLSASRIYPVKKFMLYGQSLRDMGYLPIPEPKPAK